MNDKFSNIRGRQLNPDNIYCVGWVVYLRINPTVAIHQGESEIFAASATMAELTMVIILNRHYDSQTHRMRIIHVTGV